MAKKAPLNPKQLRPLVDKLHKKLTQNIKKKPGKLNTITVEDVRWIILKGSAETRMIQLKESFKQAAIDALSPLEDASIKGLLRRVVTKIFNDVEIKGWCREFETKNASSSEAGAAAAK